MLLVSLLKAKMKGWRKGKAVDFILSRTLRLVYCYQTVLPEALTEQDN